MYTSFDTSLWEIMWKRVVRMSNVQYSLPDGVVGREFVQLLTDELGLLADGKSVSERLMCLTPMLLGRDDMIRKSCDIRRLVAKRMELWKSDHFDALASELERCAGHLTRRSKQKMDDTHTIRVFSRLMLCGKVKDATRWITGRTAGNLLILIRKQEKLF